MSAHFKTAAVIVHRSLIIGQQYILVSGHVHQHILVTGKLYMCYTGNHGQLYHGQLYIGISDSAGILISHVASMKFSVVATAMVVALVMVVRGSGSVVLRKWGKDSWILVT